MCDLIKLVSVRRTMCSIVGPASSSSVIDFSLSLQYNLGLVSCLSSLYYVGNLYWIGTMFDFYDFVTDSNRLK